MTEPILEIKDLSKLFRSHWTFRPIQAISKVNLQLNHGEAFGFLGHNGAGKTTTIKCIIGLIRKTSGQILFEGKPMEHAEQRGKIGYLPEQPYFYDHLTVYETLEFLANLHDIPRHGRTQRIKETLEMVGLSGRAKSSVRSLSKGLQQRLGLAQAIVNRPALLLLDEPFSGLDPVGRIEVRTLIMKLRDEGTTIFMSSHILPDVENICDRVVIMASGEVKAEFGLHDAAALFGERFELSLWNLDPSSPLGQQLERDAAPQAIKSFTTGNLHSFTFSDRGLAQLALQHAASAGLRIHSFSTASKSLEEIFIQVTETARSNSATWNGATESEARV